MKSIYILLFVLILGTPILGQVNLKSGLVACYPFNANAKDETGNRNNGTVNGAVLSTDRFGKANSAYNFNGNSSYIDIPSNKLQNPTFSYSAWIKPNSLPQSGIAFFIFSVGSDYGDQGIGLNNGYSNGTDGFTGGGYLDVGENAFCQQGALPNVNQWYHVVVIRSTDKYSVYVDGIFVCSTAILTKLPFYGTGTVQATIGSRWNKGQFSDCVIDDIHLYNRPLNAAEVKALYDGNSPQTITITASNPAPCGGDKITFTANGGTNTSKYQWKVDGVNQGTNSKTFDYTSIKKTGDYTVKITVEVTDEDVCFPQKPATIDQTITIKDCTPTPTGVNLKNGLVACYPFNSNAKDESGNNNNGTVNGATLTTDRFGKANSAYNFNGSSLISIPPSQFKNKSYTYSTWVKLDNLPFAGGNNCFITVGGVSGGDQVLSVTTGYQAASSNGFNIGGYNNGSPLQSNNWTGVTPSTGKWYHVVCTRDNTSMKLYVDGQLISNNSLNTTTVGVDPAYGSTIFVTFGARIDASSGGGYFQYLEGSLDDIHIYNRPLNAAEVKALYDGNTPQTITITASNSTPCGGDKITFTANSATNTSKYQWKVDGVNTGTDSKTFTFNSPNISAQYQVKISVEVTDDDPCFPNKPTKVEQIFPIKNCVIPPTSTGVNLKDGLVACYPFNANAKDESGNNNDGTVNGVTLTTDRFGKANSAYNFNGSNFIALPTDKFALTEFSYSVWIYVASNPTSGDAYRILSIGGNCGDQDINTGNTYFQGSISGIAGGGYNISSPTTNSGVVTGILPTIGKWYHGVVTRDKNEIKLYVDGVLIRAVSTNGTLPYYGCDGKVFANIGTRSTQTQFFIGNIDDVHIYNRPLNASEVKALYDGNLPQTITITASKSAPCGGDKITFTANGGTDASKYQWKVDGVNAGTNSKTFDYNSPNKLADYQVKITVEVTDDDPCFPQKPATIDKTINLKFCPTPTANANNNILIPNVFSPNGDGMNDTWEIYTLSGNPDATVEIYNRWGELVFYSKGYTQPWDGTYKDKPVPEGTYAYVVRISNETVLRGTILVVR